VIVELRRAWPSAEIAARIARAVAVDNPEYVHAGTQGRELLLRVRSTSAASARVSLDDLLACVRAAEQTLTMVKR
jgi:hypothetical protein